MFGRVAAYLFSNFNSRRSLSIVKHSTSNSQIPPVGASFSKCRVHLKEYSVVNKLANFHFRTISGRVTKRIVLMYRRGLKQENSLYLMCQKSLTKDLINQHFIYLFENASTAKCWRNWFMHARACSERITLRNIFQNYGSQVQGIHDLQRPTKQSVKTTFEFQISIVRTATWSSKPSLREYNLGREYNMLLTGVCSYHNACLSAFGLKKREGHVIYMVHRSVAVQRQLSCCIMVGSTLTSFHMQECCNDNAILKRLR